LDHLSRRFVLRLAFGFAALTLFPWLGAALVRASAGPWISSSFDAGVIQDVAAHRVSFLTIVMKASTAAGSEPSLWIAVLIGGAILTRLKRGWWPLVLLLVVLLGAVSLDRLIKMMVARARPPMSFWATSASGWSFPSGHANESAAVCLSLARMVAGNRSARIKTLAYTIAFAATFLIGVSRVYLAVHWPTDVICGWTIGAAWSEIVLGGTITE
jgi:membrane-associated phospholipid phosphatase